MNGQQVADGAIYAATSERASPDWHAGYRAGLAAGLACAAAAQPGPAGPSMVPSAYTLAAVQIVVRKQRDGTKLWAVVNEAGDVLNKQGQWEWEPLPNSRDDDFMARCRFASPLEARDAYMRKLAAAA